MYSYTLSNFFFFPIAVAQREAMKDIVSLKQDLLAAQKIRNHKLEYDRVAREIMKLDTRDAYTE